MPSPTHRQTADRAAPRATLRALVLVVVLDANERAGRV
jgi:hypothetical protein